MKMTTAQVTPSVSAIPSQERCSVPHFLILTERVMSIILKKKSTRVTMKKCISHTTRLGALCTSLMIISAFARKIILSLMSPLPLPLLPRRALLQDLLLRLILLHPLRLTPANPHPLLPRRALLRHLPLPQRITLTLLRQSSSLQPSSSLLLLLQ